MQTNCSGATHFLSYLYYGVAMSDSFEKLRRISFLLIFWCAKQIFERKLILADISLRLENELTI